MSEGSSGGFQRGAHGIITSITKIKEENLDRLRGTLSAMGAPDRESPVKAISTIHFARWVIIDGGTRLLFTSNFDESWDDYIDMFIDRASGGLDAIWSNCEGYPEGGAQDRAAFKEYVRQSEYQAELFYCAYDDLTVPQILKDDRIRQKFEALLDEFA